MKNKTGMVSILILLVMGVILFSCSNNNKITGTFVQEGAVVERIIFERDGTVRMGIMSMQYQVRGDKILVGTGGQMIPMFEIIDSNTIEGIFMGYFGTYRRMGDSNRQFFPRRNRIDLF